MHYIKNQVLNPTTAATATDTPTPNPPLTPETIVGQLRTIRGQITALSPLTVEERAVLRRKALASNEILQASINTIGASDIVSHAVGQPAEDVRGLHEDSNRWTAVEDELRGLLNGIVGANLIRRQRLAIIASQTFAISKQLVRDPANADLKPHVEEIKRLKSFQRRKKTAPAPGTPAPGTPVPASPSTAPQHALAETKESGT